jgi:glycine/D-amino acid oxidase-like deaminating enzyme
MKVIHLSGPSFEGPAQYIAGLRPFRHGGIRLEKELYKNKVIIHNYGHGGSGITLSWGSCQRAVQLFEQSYHGTTETIAILGAGIIGLTTAYLLIEKGYKVHIIAAKTTPHTTADVAAAVWGPFGIDVGTTLQEREEFYDMQRISHARFTSLTLNPILIGVSFLDSYYTPSTMDPHTGFAPDLIPSIETCKLEFKNGQQYAARVFKDLFIETPIYMANLYDSIVRQCQISHYVIEHIHQLEMLKESVIFNCTGLGSKKIFGDNQLVPIRGQLIILPQGNYPPVLLTHKYNHGKKILACFPRPSQKKCVIGATYEIGMEEEKPDVVMCKELVQDAQKFFNGILLE